MDGALTVEKLKEMMREVERLWPTVSTGLLSPFGGLGFPMFDIYDNPFLVETEEYQETVQLTPWQRWIEPISTFHNFQTMPWEPWVKTRTVTKTRQKPMRQIIRAGNALIMHPALRREVSAILTNVVA